MFTTESVPNEAACLGDNLASNLVERGAAGAIIDGPVRDVSRLRSLGFPVFATSTDPRKPKKEFPGVFDAHVRIGKVAIGPDDWVVADDDGVVVIPRHVLASLTADGR